MRIFLRARKTLLCTVAWLAGLGCAQPHESDGGRTALPVGRGDNRPLQISQETSAVISTPAAARPFRPSGPTDARQSCPHHGDVNGDGMLSASDAQSAFFIALGTYLPDEQEACQADCNGDGTISAGDAQQIFFAALGLTECAGNPGIRAVIGFGNGHLRATTGLGWHVRLGFGLLTPVGRSAPSAPGFSADLGCYPIAKEF